MWLTGNIGRAIGGASGGSDRVAARGANGIVKFGFFCSRAEQSFHKARS